MDSPYFNPGVTPCINQRVKSSHQVSILKEANRDDSGYMTVTPSSAECTRMSSDISGSLLARTPFQFHNVFCDGASSFCISSPEDVLSIKKPREYKVKPKLLFNKKSSFMETSSCVDSFTDNSIIDKCRESALPTVQEDLHGTDIVQKTGKPCLKRQKAVSDDDDIEMGCESISYDYQSSSSLFSPRLEADSSYVSNKLQKLAVVEDKKTPFFSVDSPACYRGLTQRCASSDPREYNKSLVSLNQCGVMAADKENLDLNTPHTQCTVQDVKYSCTPVKGPKKLKRSSPEESILDRSSRTPERHCPSTFTGCHSSEHKFAKKLNFESQKLGSPEKNEILYPSLKPVTPPKRMKTMTKVESPKCKKRLQMKTQSFVGREYVDFLKMLGEVQSHRPAISRILNLLSGEDLINVCKVSECWNNICKGERSAEKRRCKTLQDNEKIKENRMATKPSIKIKEKKLVSSQSTCSLRRDHLSEIQNHCNIMMQPVPKAKSPPVSPRRRRFNMYVKAASEDSTSQLRSCPRCQRPARVCDQWAVCGGPSCGYSFCSKCLMERAPGVTCCQRQLEAPSPSKQPLSRHGIGSKKSRRNLRRL